MATCRLREAALHPAALHNHDGQVTVTYVKLVRLSPDFPYHTFPVCTTYIRDVLILLKRDEILCGFAGSERDAAAQYRDEQDILLDLRRHDLQLIQSQKESHEHQQDSVLALRENVNRETPDVWVLVAFDQPNGVPLFLRLQDPNPEEPLCSRQLWRLPPWEDGIWVLLGHDQAPQDVCRSQGLTWSRQYSGDLLVCCTSLLAPDSPIVQHARGLLHPLDRFPNFRAPELDSRDPAWVIVLADSIWTISSVVLDRVPYVDHVRSLTYRALDLTFRGNVWRVDISNELLIYRLTLPGIERVTVEAIRVLY